MAFAGAWMKLQSATVPAVPMPGRLRAVRDGVPRQAVSSSITLGAPHLRLFGGQPANAAAALAPFRDHPAIHIDLGDTAAAIDMTYTRMADVYLGDVSSQVYEFLRTPKPCLFLNPGRVAWAGQESFSHWTFGPVIDELGDIRTAVAAARSGHDAWRDAQVRGFRRTFDETATPASVRAAAAIARLVRRELDLSDLHPLAAA